MTNPCKSPEDTANQPHSLGGKLEPGSPTLTGRAMTLSVVLIAIGMAGLVVYFQRDVGGAVVAGFVIVRALDGWLVWNRHPGLAGLRVVEICSLVAARNRGPLRTQPHPLAHQNNEPMQVETPIAKAE